MEHFYKITVSFPEEPQEDTELIKVLEESEVAPFLDKMEHSSPLFTRIASAYILDSYSAFKHIVKELDYDLAVIKAVHDDSDGNAFYLIKGAIKKHLDLMSKYKEIYNIQY